MRPTQDYCSLTDVLGCEKPLKQHPVADEISTRTCTKADKVIGYFDAGVSAVLLAGSLF